MAPLEHIRTRRSYPLYCRVCGREKWQNVLRVLTGLVRSEDMGVLKEIEWYDDRL
jgi:hypothetical protein